MILLLLFSIIYVTNGCNNVAMKQDTTFVLDGGSHVSNAEWDLEKTFVDNILSNFTSSSDYSVSIYSWGDETIGAYSLDVSFATSTSAKSTLSSLTKYVTSTPSQPRPNVQAALSNAISAHEARDSSRRRVIVLIAAEESIIEVCTIYPRESNVFFYVVAVNSTDYYVHSYDCLVTQRKSKMNGIQYIDSFSGLSDVRDNLMDLICPDDPIVKITEVRPDNPANNRAAFVEMYNYGRDILLHASVMNLEPFFVGDITAATVTTWAQGSYLVVYSGSEDPDCSSGTVCNSGDCTTVSTYFCTESEYLKCGAASATYGTYDATCSYGYGTYQNFTVTLKIGGIEIDSVTYGNDNYWSSGTLDYSYELKYDIWDSLFGSSWVRSCDTVGTPGVTHAVCNSVSCATDGFYDNENTCDLAPLPMNCYGLVVDSTPGSSKTRYRWDLADYDGHHFYRGVYCPNPSGSCTSVRTLVGASEDSADENVAKIPMQLSTRDSDWLSDDYSVPINCSRNTMEPTGMPTASPTYSSPMLSTCSVRVNVPAVGFHRVEWVTETFSSDPPPSTGKYYNVYHNFGGSPVKTDFNSNAVETDVAIAFNPSTDTAELEVVYPQGIGYSDKITCDTVITFDPSMNPTGNPTANPAASDPTGNPTQNPTPSPSYQDIEVYSCDINIVGGSPENGQISWTQNPFFPPLTAEASETRFEIRWRTNNSLFIFGFESSPTTKTFVPQLMVSDTVTIQPFWDINDPINGLESGSGAILPCTVSSESPTNIPSNTPSANPVGDPSISPMPEPSGDPSNSPTLSPTYIPPNTPNCTVEFDSERTIYTASFSTIIPDVSEIFTPNTHDIRYIFQFYAGEILSETHDNLYANNLCSSDPCDVQYVQGLVSPWNATRDLGIYPKFRVEFLFAGSIIVSNSSWEVCYVITQSPSISPTYDPSGVTSMPSLIPSQNPSLLPSAEPSMNPTNVPSMNPSITPSSDPSTAPVEGSKSPTGAPTIDPNKSDGSSMHTRFYLVFLVLGLFFH